MFYIAVSIASNNQYGNLGVLKEVYDYRILARGGELEAFLRVKELELYDYGYWAWRAVLFINQGTRSEVRDGLCVSVTYIT